MIRSSLSVLAACGLLFACASQPPSSNQEIMRQLAADSGGQKNGKMLAETPADEAAIRKVAEEIQVHLSSLHPASSPSAASGDGLEIRVTAARTMSGSWRMVLPTELKENADAPDRYGKVRSFLCRLDQTGERLVGGCLPWRRDISGRVEGDAVRFGWVAGLANGEIRGRLLSATDFAGDLVVGMVGIDMIDTGLPVYARKIETSPAAPGPVEEMASAVIDDLASANFSASRYDAVLRKSMMESPPLTPNEVRKLGAVHGTSYLGAVEIPAESDPPRSAETMHVYDIAFLNGWKLCGFAQTRDGVIDRIECR